MSQGGERVSNKTTLSCGGGSFTSLLTIVFIVLKLTHVINWSWVMVFSPMWIGILLMIAVVGFAFIVALILKVLVD